MAPPATTPSSSQSPSSIPQQISRFLPSPLRVRSYILRLPLFTRIILFAIVAFYVLEWQSAWNVIEWGSIIPKSVGITTGGMYRLNTYPVVHLGFFHMLINACAVVPLLERFEAEWGTINAVALFLGPLSTLPGGIYILIQRLILNRNTPILGASVWVFLLLSSESIKTYRANPHFDIASYKIPTWISPLLLNVATAVLLPGTSFLGHLCGCAIGYGFGLGYLKFLAPPEKVSRWIEGRLNLLGRLPHYVSVDQKTYGRYGVLPSTSSGRPGERSVPIGMEWLGDRGQRLGP